MPTAVVSGRVNEQVKHGVDRILERAGKSQGDVIKDIWEMIYKTGELPATRDHGELLNEKHAKFDEFMAFRATLSDAPDWLVNLTDEQMNDIIAQRSFEAVVEDV